MWSVKRWKFNKDGTGGVVTATGDTVRSMLFPEMRETVAVSLPGRVRAPGSRAAGVPGTGLGIGLRAGTECTGTGNMAGWGHGGYRRGGAHVRYG